MNTLISRLNHALELTGKKPADLARACDVTQGAVTHWLNGETRNLRTAKALRAAAFLGVTVEWLTEGRGQMTVDSTNTTMQAPSNCLEIRQFDTGGSMGDGLLLRDQPGIIENWCVSQEWLQKNLKGYANTKNLAIVTGFGDSMKPMYNPGDPLIVDTSFTTVEFDGVYFFRVENEGFIKRLQKIPGVGILVLSDNKDYIQWPMPLDKDWQVFGRVIKVWKSEDL